MDEPLSNLDAKLRVTMRGGTEPLPSRPRRHHRLRHPRPARSDDHVGPDRCHARRHRAAVRHAGGSLQPPGQPVRRRLHRQPADELHHRAARRRRGAQFNSRGLTPLPVRLASPRASWSWEFGRRTCAGRRGRGRGPRGRVWVVELLGSEKLVEVTTANAAASPSKCGPNQLNVDELVGVRFDPLRVHLFDADSGVALSS